MNFGPYDRKDPNPPQGFDPLPTQKRVPLCTILKYPFLVTNLKNFQRRFWRQYKVILRGERAPKTQFFGQSFSKNACFFFQNFDCSAEKLAKTESFYCFGRPRKINIKMVDLK